MDVRSVSAPVKQNHHTRSTSWNASTEEHSRASQASSKSQQAFMEIKAPSSRVAASAPSLKASAAKSGLAVEHKPMAREQKWWENYN